MRRDARPTLDRLTATLIVGLLRDLPPDRRQRWENSQIFGRIVARARYLSHPPTHGEQDVPPPQA